ncbi:hypothetical protein WJ0W_001739 [Paenibacillus melissococcoides]|uniref:Uncharacterized protein n=1 Tax=Paenibacillus melissococcoides TaxID=2912268 RepID=A0ABM9FZ37_9BACL|nr:MULTISPECIES: hypothetical protein [Paenibacillus]MEB9895597.1 hypothetical protein [Bacillus cereus]CAH8244504.1 hypothetical protein WJ0W_001739 [Paenibacillus melissococcoides]CAH8708178.1 hypothetical protein WDD9_001826 [Paenibacillus melissococcoides]CAH8708884.1 hypothetical protein HTL2_002111 [Paenibacillus melissococcoides]GIO80405.1 hypothetical protein J6TS7_40150 [Paenibacillus dendritiformis]
MSYTMKTDETIGISKAPMPKNTSKRLMAIALFAPMNSMMMAPMIASIIPKPRPATGAAVSIHSHGGRKQYTASPSVRAVNAKSRAPRRPMRLVSSGVSRTPTRNPAN